MKTETKLIIAAITMVGRALQEECEAYRQMTEVLEGAVSKGKSRRCRNE